MVFLVSIKIVDIDFEKAFSHQLHNFKAHRGSLVHLVESIFFTRKWKFLCLSDLNFNIIVYVHVCVSAFVCMKVCPISSKAITYCYVWSPNTILYNIYYIVFAHIHLSNAKMKGMEFVS